MIAQAQDLKIPQPSTLQKIEQDFGLGQIIITYSRPNVKGRKMFGETEPYGLVWRTGANAATKIKLTDTILMEKHQVLPLSLVIGEAKIQRNLLSKVFINLEPLQFRYRIVNCLRLNRYCEPCHKCYGQTRDNTG